MRKLTFLPLVVQLSGGVLAQNLVTNGNFSIKAANSPCKLGTGFVKGRPDGWWDEESYILATGDTLLPFAETPDYYHPCSPIGIRHPSNNSRGCADPKSGTAYIGLMAWSKNHPDRSTEYIYQELATPLVKNQAYYIEFWVSAADDPQFNYFVASLGMYLTNSTLDFENDLNTRGYHYLASAVQIPNTFPATEYYTTVKGWQRISGTFTPTVDGVKHILIGNFDPGIAAYDPVTNPNSPNIQHRPGADPGDQPGDGQTSYYYIDAVYIAPASLGVPNLSPVISGPDAICYSGSAYTLTNVPPGANVSWTTSPASLITPTAGGGTTAVVSATSWFARGTGSLAFTINGVCDQLFESKTFPVGRPGAITGPMSGPANVASYQVHQYSVPAQSLNDGNITWTYPADWGFQSSGTSPYVYAFFYIGTQSGYVQVRKTNACGNGGAKWRQVTVTSSGGDCPECPVIIEMAANPLQNNLTLRYGDRANNKPLPQATFDRPAEYIIRNAWGDIVLAHTPAQTALQLDVSHIGQKGVYFLTVTHPGKGHRQYRLVK